MARPKAYPIKKVIGFDPEMWERIRDYRFAQRIDTENETIRRLIEAGLKGADTIPIRGPKPEPAASGGDAEKAPADTGKPAARSRKPPAPKAAPMSQMEQLRALREHGAR